MGVACGVVSVPKFTKCMQEEKQSLFDAAVQYVTAFCLSARVHSHAVGAPGQRSVLANSCEIIERN